MLATFVAVACFDQGVETFVESDRVSQVPTIDGESSVVETIFFGELALVVRYAMVVALVRTVDAPGHAEVVFGAGSVERRFGLAIDQEFVVAFVPLSFSGWV